MDDIKFYDWISYIFLFGLILLFMNIFYVFSYCGLIMMISMLIKSGKQKDWGWFFIILLMGIFSFWYYWKIERYRLLSKKRRGKK